MADSAKDFVVKQNLRVTGNIVSAGAGSVFTGDGAQLDNVDAVTLGGESGGFYRDATNLNAGTISNDRLPATITKNLTGNVTGNVDATDGSGTVDADSGRFTTISGTTASFNTYVGVYGNFDTFDEVFDSSFTRDTFKANVFDPAFDSSLSRKSADDIADGQTNKFYTTARFDSDFGTKSTTDLTEGSNLYYTEARVDSDITTTINKAFVDALNINADQVDGVEATSFVRSDQDDTVGANIQFTDGNELRFGTGNDTIIKHTGTQTTVNHTGTGNLVFQADEQTRLTIEDDKTTVTGKLHTDSVTSTAKIEGYDIRVDNMLDIYESAAGRIAGHLEGTAAEGLQIHYHSQIATEGLKIIAHDSAELVGTTQMQFTFSDGISFENQRLKLVADPITNQDAATKAYVDNTSQGLVVKDGVKAASTADLSTLPNVGTVTYNNTAGPDSGVGSGFSFTGQLDSIDGHTFSSNDRVLIKDQTNTFENGIYRWVNNTTLTRAVDADQDSELGGGVFVFVENGSVNASNGYVTSHSGLTNVGTDPILWTQFSGAGFIEAGDGLLKTGNVIDVNLSDGAGGTSGLKVETDQLKINLGAGGTGLEISSNVLQIADDGVTASKVNFGLGAGQISTADLPEDSVSGNTYFTVARARGSINAGAGISYDSASGVVSINNTSNAGVLGSSTRIPVITVTAEGLIDSIGTAAVAGVDSVAFDSSTGVIELTLGDASIKTAQVVLDAFSTDNLSEGSTNQYYLKSRVDSDIDLRVPTIIDSDYLDDFVRPLSRLGYDSGTLAPFARAAISVAGAGVSYEQGTGVITVATVTNSFQVTQAGHGLREGHAVYEDDVAGWVKAFATDSGHQLATHVVVDYVDSDTFAIAQNGIFTIGETGSVSPAISLTAGEYYYTGNVDSGIPVIAQPATSVQPLFYALSSTQIELSVEHAINVFSPDEPLNVSSTAGNFTVSGNLKVNGLGVPKVATVSPGGTYYFDSGNVAKLTMSADASVQFDSPGTLYDGAGFTILAKNTDASAHRLTLTTPNGVTLHTVGENKVTVNAGNIAILSGVIYGEKDILLTSTQMDSSITG